MELEELKEDMIALRTEATTLAPAVGETLANIAKLLLEAERVAKEMQASGQAAHNDVNELATALAAWQGQARSSRDEVAAGMQAIDATLGEQLPILETARQELADVLRETAGSAATFDQDIRAAAPKVQEAEKEALAGLEGLGSAAQRSEDELKQGVEAARLEAEQLGDRVESGTDETVADLQALKITVETLAQQAEATVANVGVELGQGTVALTDAVLEAVQTIGTGHEAFLKKLDAGVVARLDDWRQATQEAVDATDELVHDVDEARQHIEKSAGTIETSFTGLSTFEGVVNKVVQDVQEAALTAGLDWIL